MSLCGFTAEASLYKASQHHYMVASVGTAIAEQAVMTASLPSECQQPGASQPWTDTHCAGPFGAFTMWCQDKCRVPDPNHPAQGREVGGLWYPCGVCSGFW